MVNTIREGAGEPITEWWERYTSALEKADTHRLRVFVRSLRPAPGSHDHRERMFERIRTATEQSTIDEFDVQVLGEEICLCPQCEELADVETIHDTARKVADWDDGTLVASGFKEREVNCSFTHEQYRVLVPPETALGVYLDGSLAGVFPCTTDRTEYSIETFLNGVLEGNPPADSTTRTESRRLTT